LTLFRSVGLPQSPASALLGGRTLGIPLLPSIEYMRAVDSPHTNAPAPSAILTSKASPLPRTSLPRSPLSRAWRMAIRSLSTASGYSRLTYTYPSSEPTARPATIMPSSTEWGSLSMIVLSMNAPGSPSSALQMKYF
jgi:hypothetical protein